ncbi:MAG: hypothetical protein QM504_15300 [Pseudomonadota bacterium]
MTEHTYIIQLYALGSHNSFDITEDQYHEIKQAHQFNEFGSAFEEKLDLILMNYADLERELLDMSLQHSIFRGSIHELLIEGMHRVNRRLINLLTAIRLYQDQVSHSLSTVYGNTSTNYASFKTVMNKEYDDNLSYRAIEAIRNHVQHSSLPVTSIIFSEDAVEKSPKDPKDYNQQIGFNVMPFIGIQYLEADKKFKKNTLKELKGISSKSNNIELVPLVRQYISSVARIHTKVRNLCKDDLEFSENTITTFRKTAEEKLGHASEGLAAIQCDSAGEFTEHVFLTNRPQKRWKSLQSKNIHLEQSSIRFVTSKHA